MGDHDQRGADTGGLLAKQGHAAGLVCRIEARGGFIGKNQSRLGHKSPADGDPLAFPLGHRPGMTREEIADAHRSGESSGPLPDGTVERQSVTQVIGQQNVVLNREIIDQFKLLKDHADAGSTESLALRKRKGGEGLVGNTDGSLGRNQNTGDELEEGALTATTWSDNGDGLPFRDLKRSDPERKLTGGILEKKTVTVNHRAQEAVDWEAGGGKGQMR